ncbi:MAG: hypothetical protein R3264_15950 [Anaerolineae bacterium]|nr:hypothetical protein [Anaerolineae bacterium]
MKNINAAAIIFFFGLGVCPLLIGLTFFWTTGQSSTITCTRLETTHVDCRIERAFLGIIPSEEVTVSRVTGTELTTTCEDNSCTYAVDLLTDGEAVAVLTGLATSDLESVEAEKERLDEFLNNPAETSLEFNSGPAWLGMLISIPFIVVGGVITGRGIKAILTKTDTDDEAD